MFIIIKLCAVTSCVATAAAAALLTIVSWKCLGYSSFAAATATATTLPLFHLFLYYFDIFISLAMIWISYEWDCSQKQKQKEEITCLKIIV